jgi:hypothetical protein
MPVTQVGLVYYTDDPTQSYFRIVYPSVDDSELNQPQWLTDGVDPNRTAAMNKVPISQAPGLGGLTISPSTSASQAVLLLAATAPAVISAQGTANAVSALTAAQTAAQAASVKQGATASSILTAAQTAAKAVSGSAV